MIVTIPPVYQGGRGSYRLLIDRNGNTTKYGKYFYQKLNEQPPNRTFDPHQPTESSRGRTETIKLRDGSRVAVRVFNAVKNEWRLTRLGKQFYSKQNDRWTVNIPVKVHHKHKNGTYYVRKAWVASTSIAVLGELSFSSTLPEEQQRAEVIRQVGAWLSTIEEKFDGETLILEGDYDPQTLDTERAIQYNREEVRPEANVGEQVTAAIHRPLRDLRPWIFCDMLNVESLAPEGFEVPEGSNCVVHQLETLVLREGVRAWSRRDIESWFDEIQAEFYSEDDGDNPYWDEGVIADWRDLGVTAKMVLELCRQQGVAINILWNNTVVESFFPETRRHQRLTTQALHIRGDHAYFLEDRYARGWITRQEDMPIQARASDTMQTLAKPPQTSIADWLPLPPLPDDDLQGDFYAVGEQEMHEARTELHKAGIVPAVSLSGPCPQNAKKLTVSRPGKPKAVVHRIHEEHVICRAFVDIVNADTGGSLVYTGESPGGICFKAFEEQTTATKRQEITEELREQILVSQGTCCADCGDELGKGGFEIDHRIPLRFGGNNKAPNLAAICKHCHHQKTSFENAACHLEDRNPLLSRFSQETYKAFVLSPKPPQLVCNLHEAVEGQATLHVDVKRCRMSQFLENVHGVPVFCALDKPVRATPGQLGDFHYVHRTRDLRSPLKLLPYWGKGWYWRGEVEWMLDAGVLQWSEIKYTLTASARFPASYLADRLRQLEAWWQQAQEQTGSGCEAKFALNSLFGLWSIIEQHVYHLEVASDREDIVAKVLSKSPAPGCEESDGTYLLHDYTTKTRIRTFASMRPVSQICLSMERHAMAKLVHLILRQLGPREARCMLSIRNDGMSVQPGNKHYEPMRKLLEEMTYGKFSKLLAANPLRRHCAPLVEQPSDSEAKVFRVEAKAPDMPGGVLAIREDISEVPFELPEQAWKVESEEPDEDTFYERCIQPHVIGEGRGAIITGPAGAGKSTILARLEADLKEQGHRVRKVALTHVATKRLGLDASTVHSFIHHFVLHGSFSGWLLIDEFSLLPATLLTLLENLRSLPGNVKFVLFGDWNQLLPPMNRWRMDPVAGDAFQHSRLFHDWGEGAQFRLTRCRRAQSGFFNLCQSLLAMSKEAAVRHCRSSFPPAEGPLHLQGKMHLVLSHKRRVKLNGICQKAAVERYRAENPEGCVANIAPEEEAEAGGSLNVAQAFQLFAGTCLVGASNEASGVVNGVFLTVGLVREADCDVTDEFGNCFALTFAAISRSTRLAWAITVTSSQSREFDCPVVLWDLGSPFYTLRHLYVAITRVRRPEFLVVAPN